MRVFDVERGGGSDGIGAIATGSTGTIGVVSSVSKSS